MDDYLFLGNSPPTLPLTQHFALSDNLVLMLGEGRGIMVLRKWRRQIRISQFANSHNGLGVKSLA